MHFYVKILFRVTAVQGLEDNSHKIITFWTFNLLKCLNIVITRAVHYTEHLRYES